MSGLGIGLSRVFPGTGGLSPALELLLYEDFSVDDAAPISTPKACTPGPGELNYVDTVTGADASISGGLYLRPRPTGGQGYANYGTYSTGSFQRVPGLFFYTRSRSSIVDGVVPISMAISGALSDGGANWFNWAASTVLDLKEVGNSDVRFTGLSFTAGAFYHWLLLPRSAGCNYLVKGGSQYPDWTFLWSAVLSNTTPLYIQSSNFNAQYDAASMVVGQLLKSPFTLDYGIATYVNPFPVDGDVVVGEDDGLIYFTWRPTTGETLSIRFRRVDDDNCYRLDCIQATNTIKLYRRQSGVDTELDAGKTQAWTAGSVYRICIIHVAGAVHTRVASTAKHNVTGETFNLTETGVKVSGFDTASFLEIYPRTNPNGWKLLEQLEVL